MTPCSPMAFSNLNNPYSPQPATPAGSTSGEDVFNMSQNTYMGDGMVTAVSNVEDVTNQQVVLDQRSRHNSAESDPSLVKSAPMSPTSVMNQNNSYVEIGGQRLRHQSAGNPPNPALATLKPPNWIQDPTLTFATSDDLQVHNFLWSRACGHCKASSIRRQSRSFFTNFSSNRLRKTSQFETFDF